EDEIRWQFDHMSPATRVALRQLPRVGADASGPLGPGRLASGLLGTIIRRLQSSLMDLDEERPSQTSGDASGPAPVRTADPLATNADLLRADTPESPEVGESLPCGTDHSVQIAAHPSTSDR